MESHPADRSLSVWKRIFFSYDLNLKLKQPGRQAAQHQFTSALPHGHTGLKIERVFRSYFFLLFFRDIRAAPAAAKIAAKPPVMVAVEVFTD